MSPNTSASAATAGVNQDATTAIEQADVALGVQIAARARGNDPLARALRTVGGWCDQEPLYAAGAGLLAVGLVARQRRLAGAGTAVLAAVAAADGGKRVVKRFVRRTRPNVLLNQGRYEADVGGTGEKPEQSFPSGHVACGLAAAVAVARRYPVAGALACVVTAAVGVGRIARAAHWPLDVAAGAAIGLVAEWVSERVLRAVGLSTR